MPCVVLIVKGRGHRAGGVQQIESAAFEPPYVPRDPCFIPRFRAFLTAQKIDERAFTRVGDTRDHKTEGSIQPPCKRAFTFFFRNRVQALQ